MSKPVGNSISKAIQYATFLYITACCNEIGHKEPCQKSEGETSLGTWRCSKCRKVAKVRAVAKKDMKPESKEAI